MMWEPNMKARRRAAKTARSLNGTGDNGYADIRKELKSIHDDWNSLETDYRERLKQALVRVARVAMNLQDAPELWDAFISDPKNEKYLKGTKPKIEKSVACVLHCTIKGSMENRKRRVSKFSRVLDYLLENGIEPEGIAEQLDEWGGIEKVYDAIRSNEKEAAENADHSPDDAGDDDTEDQSERRRKSAKAQAKEAYSSNDSCTRSSKPAGSKPLKVEFEVSQADFDTLLGPDDTLKGMLWWERHKGLGHRKLIKITRVRLA